MLRRAELARQSQRELQRRKAEIAEEKRKQEQDQKRKQAAADARKRKREREDELIRLQLEERHERLREKERARLRARYGDAWSEGAPEVLLDKDYDTKADVFSAGVICFSL